MTRALNVFIDDAIVGNLYENNGIWSFHYYKGWQENGYPLSPGLPLQPEEIKDTGSVRPVQWFFDNLLPEEDARKRLVSALPKGEWDAWELLAHLGSESAGAITILKPDAQPKTSKLTPLSNQELDKRIKNMPRVSLGSTSPKKMSLAGAQEKLVISIVDGELYDPEGSEISTHILKPDSLNDDYPNSAVNEWFCARVAQELKLNVPPVQLRYVPSPVYIIERYDREMVDGKIKRLHALDAAQTLSISSGSKYTMADVNAFNTVINTTRSKTLTRLNIYKWVVFNVLIGNGDSHLKNLSLFSNKSGYELAPFYDLISTVSFVKAENGKKWHDEKLTFPIGEAETFGEVGINHFYQFASGISLPSRIAQNELYKLAESIEAAADRVLKEFEEKEVPKQLRASQLRMINLIRYMPIAEMASKLKI
ncbi:MAG: HipA domain-containing protein [Methylophilaceae bacterium]